VEDQPPDIEAQIRNLIMPYIFISNAIILAITPANVDFSTSEAVKFVEQVDPEGRFLLHQIVIDTPTDPWLIYRTRNLRCFNET
jgi:replication fork clamp-binding protein CrfC